MGLFKKLTGQASNFFKKAGGTADNLFKKTTDVVTKTADQAGRGIVQTGNFVGENLKQAGNVLEKAAPIAGEVGAGLAILAGQPEIAVPLMSASVAAQQAGARAKQIGGQIKSTSVAAQGMINTQSNALNNTLVQANQQLQSSNANIQQRLNAAANPSVTLPANNLAAIHSDLAQ